MAGLVGLRSVGDHHLDPPAPPLALLDEEPRQGNGISVSDHAEDLAGLAVEQHGDVAVAPAQRRLVHQQHSTALGPAVLAHPGRPGPHQAHDRGPGQQVTAGQLADGDHPGVDDQLAGQATGEPAFDLGMVLGVAGTAVGALEARRSQMRVVRWPRQVAHPSRPGLVDRLGPVPAGRAADHRPQVGPPPPRDGPVRQPSPRRRACAGDGAARPYSREPRNRGWSLTGLIPRIRAVSSFGRRSPAG